MALFHQIRPNASEDPLTPSLSHQARLRARSGRIPLRGEGRPLPHRLPHPFGGCEPLDYLPAVLNSLDVFFTKSQTTS